MIETERLLITEALTSDIDLIIELENHPDNKDYIWQGTYEEHLDEINDPAHLLLVARKKKDNAIIGLSLYESLSMHRDGILRQNYKAKRGYLDQIIYSILRQEYFSAEKKNG